MVGKWTREEIKEHCSKLNMPLQYPDEDFIVATFSNPLKHLNSKATSRSSRQVLLAPELCYRVPVEAYALRLALKLPLWERCVAFKLDVESSFSLPLKNSSLCIDPF